MNLNNNKDKEDISNKINGNRKELHDLRMSIFTRDLCDSNQYISSYFKTFDKPEKGLNNYADTILSKVKNLNNVSRQWSSNIDSEKLIANFIKTFVSENEATPPIKISDETRKLALSANLNAIKFRKRDDKTLVTSSLIHNSPKTNVSIPKLDFHSMTVPSPTTSGSLSYGTVNALDSTNRSNELAHKRSFVACSSTSDSWSSSAVNNSEYDTNVKGPRPLKIQSRNDNNFDGFNQNNQHQDSNDFPFRSARQQLNIDLSKKNTPPSANVASLYGNYKKSLGTRRGARSEFVPPVPTDKVSQNASPSATANIFTKPTPSNVRNGGDKCQAIIGDERLKQFQPEMVELILNEIMDSDKSVTWDDICGLESAKKILQEIVILPMLRPDIFTGLRGPPKGMLLFGPPGTGKTLIGKCIASHSKSTFFSISASSLTSKWVGEGEKMVRALFAIARVCQPAVIFIDEIDSLLTQRSESEHESSRRIKTEFLVQLDGISTGENDRLLLVGATNRPQEIDEAARRRFVKRLYIPLPSFDARKNIIENLLKGQLSVLSANDIETVVQKSDGYSGADVANLCKEAAMGPVRGLRLDQFESMALKDVRAITFRDFEEALNNVKSSVSTNDLDQYIKWNTAYGSYQIGI